MVSSILGWGDSSNLRLYEEEERDLFERTRCHPQSFRRLDWGAQIRFRRFFDSVVGFHSVSLNISERLLSNIILLGILGFVWSTRG